MAISKKGMQYNSAAPKETMMTGDLSGKMEGKPMKGMKETSRISSGGPGMGGERKGMMRKGGNKGRMGY